MADVRQDHIHIQSGVLERSVDLRRRAIDVVRRQFGADKRDARLHQLHSGGFRRAKPRVPAVDRQLGEDVEETVDLIQSAAEIRNRCRTHRR